MNTGSLSNGLMTSGKWKLLLTDTANNTFESIIYETISGESCLHSNLMRFKWTSVVVLKWLITVLVYKQVG
jgi:hypothetical protein